MTRFGAVGHYSDGSSYDISETADAWDTGSTLVATVSNAPGSRGVVLGVGLGSTPVIATQQAVSRASGRAHRSMPLGWPATNWSN